MQDRSTKQLKTSLLKFLYFVFLYLMLSCLRNITFPNLSYFNFLSRLSISANQIPQSSKFFL